MKKVERCMERFTFTDEQRAKVFNTIEQARERMKNDPRLQNRRRRPTNKQPSS